MDLFPISDGLKVLTSKWVAMVLSQTKILQALSEKKCLVVATGGGPICKDDNWYILSTSSYFLHVEGL